MSEPGPRDGVDPPTVLVVDDDEQLLELYRLHLEDRYRVRTAGSGAEALERLDDAVDLVVLDRRMPEMTGDEVLAALRDRGFDGPVTMVTAVNPGTDIVDMPFDDYLVKPVAREELTNLIASLLRRASYEEGIREYFAAASKKAVLETELAPSELATDEEYRRLVDRLAALERDARVAVDDLPQEEIELLFWDLDPTPSDLAADGWPSEG